jgi:signal transduction histidine kinase
VARGHIGLDSHRVKIESAGGEFQLVTPPAGGTAVRVSVPARDVSADLPSDRGG